MGIQLKANYKMKKGIIIKFHSEKYEQHKHFSTNLWTQTIAFSAIDD